MPFIRIRNRQFKKFLNLIIKLLIISIGLFYFVHQWSQKNTEEFKILLSAWINGKFGIYTLIIMALMLINWLLEAHKWKILTHRIDRIPIFHSLMNVWTGLFTGSFSPGRALEFAGRVFFHRPDKWPELIFRYFLSSFIQFYITVTFAVILWPYLPFFSFSNKGAWITLMFIFLFSSGYFLLKYFSKNEKKIEFFLRKKVFDKFSFRTETTAYVKLNNYELMSITVLGILRYLVFTFQLLLVIQQVLPYNVELITLVSFISAYYLLTSVLPMISLLEIPLRSWIAYTLAGPAGISLVHITFSVTFIWLINILIPSIAGMLIFVFRFNPEKWSKLLELRKKES
jgi:hypothetical protein